MFKYFLTVIVLGIITTKGANSASRIIGGEDAKLGEFPHQISLRYTGRHTCGGSIIHPLYILTAAHCVNGRPYDQFYVVSGTISLLEGGEVHEIDKITEHENYEPSNSYNNDIAIIKLKKAITFNANQKKINLPTSDTGVEDALFSGWGKLLYPGNALPEILQKMSVRTLTNDDCNLEHRNPILPGHLCGFNKLGIGACQGDSGGPLITLDGEVQIGVVSWVFQYCALGVSDVYVRVYHYLEWINAVTENALKE